MKEEKTFLKSRHSMGVLILVVLVIGFIIMLAEVYGQESNKTGCENIADSNTIAKVTAWIKIELKSNHHLLQLQWINFNVLSEKDIIMKLME